MYSRWNETYSESVEPNIKTRNEDIDASRWTVDHTHQVQREV